MTRGAERRSRSYARGRRGDVRLLEVGTARRIGKALTNSPPYPVGGRAIVRLHAHAGSLVCTSGARGKKDGTHSGY